MSKITKIEWCDSSWNPITGCYHECEYCYARKLANRYKGCDDSPDGSVMATTIMLDGREYKTSKNGSKRYAPYPYNFTPAFHRYRLLEPSTKGKLGETVFVCSMADMFGEWVPDEWIEEIFDACMRAPDHRYLFLTKNPSRYWRLAKAGKLPKQENFWYGTTVTAPDVQFFFADEYNTFVSVEPVLEPFEGLNASNPHTNWVIIGAETGRRPGKVFPEKSWVEELVAVSRLNGIPVFMKDSMKPIWGDDIPTEFPWRKDTE